MSPVRGADIACLEGESAYDVRWPWQDGALRPGLTCVFRLKNEAHNLPWVLPPMLEAVQHVVIVDNLSDDGTPEVAQRVAEECGAGDRITVTSYPFQVSRAGSEHLATRPDSVHSLTHFYNWSFSHVRTAYSMKWDGDMVLTREGVSILRDLSWQLEDSNAIVAVPRHPLSVESDQVAWLDLGFRFLEPWIYPMGPEFTFVKAFEWEVREFPESTTRIVAPEGSVRGAEVARPRRVRALERHGLRHLPRPPQAPRVAGLLRAQGGPRPRGPRPAPHRVARRRARRRPRHPHLAAPRRAPPGAPQGPPRGLTHGRSSSEARAVGRAARAEGSSVVETR